MLYYRAGRSASIKKTTRYYGYTPQNAKPKLKHCSVLGHSYVIPAVLKLKSLTAPTTDHIMPLSRLQYLL